MVVGDADRGVVGVDVDWSWVGGCGWDEGGQGGGDLPRGVLGVFGEEGLFARGLFC